MRRVGDRPLWIGSAGDVRDPRQLMDAGIRAVVEVSYTEPFASLPRDLARFRFPLHDGGGNPDWLVRMAVRTVQTLLSDGVPTIVCCSFGMNRSVCVAAAALAVAAEIPAGEALKLAALSGPSDVSPALWAEVCRAAVAKQLVDEE